ncbi:MAG: hypothetical protein WDA16_09230 [Candidatus Thermoplasmatota archaeon]
MAKPKREDAASAKDGDYEFKLPAFDEKAFVRREVLSARASFITVGLGLVAGILATVVQRIAGQPLWYYGWVPLIASLLVLRPLLQRMDFPEDVTAPKAIFGSLFMLFFTGLAIWVIGVNFA